MMEKFRYSWNPTEPLSKTAWCFPCGIYAAYYALRTLKASWALLDMFWNGCVFEVAVATGISLKDWKLSKFWQLSHFSFTVIHHCITIRRARTHCCRGKRGSSANGGTSSAVGGAQVMRKHWCGHTSFVEVLSASYFNNPLPPTSHHHTPYHMKLYRGLSGFLRDCLAQGTQHLLGSPHKSPPGAAESGRYHSGRPAARQWQMHTFSQKYKALCCWADYGTANPMKTHDWKGVK